MASVSVRSGTSWRGPATCWPRKSKREEHTMADVERDYYKEYEGEGERDMLIGF